MKKKKKHVVFTIASLACFAVIIIVSIGIINKQNQNVAPKNNMGFTVQTLEHQKSTFVEVYEEEYQNQVHETIQELKNSFRYNLSNPLLIQNPYQTVTNGLYVYFETNKNYQVEYVITADGYRDFVQRVPADAEDDCAKVHEFLMVGLIMGENNHITMNLLDEKNKVVKTVSFEYECPKAAGQFNVNRIEVNQGESVTPVSQGLYVMLGNDIDKQVEDGELKEAYTAMYDNDGVLRVEIPIITHVTHRLLFDENGMYFSVSKSRIVRMDRTGYVNAVFKLGKYFLHHDYLFGNHGDIVVLGTDNAEGTIEDVVFSIDLETKKISTIIDLKKMFPNYYQMTIKPENNTHLDWMHINSISFVDEESILLSSRETSTIIKLDHIYDEPTIDYMIGSEIFWKCTGYEQYLLKQDGDFSLHAGQHTVTYLENPEGETNQYYIYLYNNNNTVSVTRPDYNWFDDLSYENTGQFLTSNGANSSYYKYLVDTAKRTFTLVDCIEVDYSAYVSSVQEYQGNIIINSGLSRMTWEYDSNGELIQEVKVLGNNYVYRTYKYDFEGFWFRNK